MGGGYQDLFLGELAPEVQGVLVVELHELFGEVPAY